MSRPEPVYRFSDSRFPAPFRHAGAVLWPFFVAANVTLDDPELLALSAFTVSGMAGVAGFLWLGGLDGLKQLLLLTLLRLQGRIPGRFVHWLDHADDLTFLKRVGGGYIFSHRRLLEHFAKGAEG